MGDMADDGEAYFLRHGHEMFHVKVPVKRGGTAMVTRYDVWIGQSELQLRRMKQLRAVRKTALETKQRRICAEWQRELDKLITQCEDEIRDLAKIAPFDRML